MKRRTVLALTAAIALSSAVAACQGFKEAFTAHVDVAAKAGSQELTVEQLSKLLSGVQVPVTPDIAKAITNIWVDYQLLGEAAANNDTLNQPKIVDDALWAFLSQQREGKFHEQLMKSYPGLEGAGTPANYAKGEYLAAQHILFMFPPTASAAQKDSTRREAQRVRAQLTSANFAEMAMRYSKDPGSASRGGELGVFRNGPPMVQPFLTATAALQPGQISGPVQSQFGYHLIRRHTLAEVKEEFAREASGPAIARADSIWMSGLEASANIKFKDNAAQLVKTAVTDLDAHTKDNAVLATWKGGDFTVSRLVKWLESAPQKEQLAEQVRGMQDSVVIGLLKQVLRHEIVLAAADSAKVVIDSADLAKIHERYSMAVVNTWTQLNVTPTLLADSAKSVKGREAVAARLVNEFLDKLMKQQVQFVAVAPPVQQVARTKYGVKLSAAGMQRAVEETNKAKAAADSARLKSRPPTEVPIGAPPAGTKPGKPGPR